jgi:hypothetical protein
VLAVVRVVLTGTGEQRTVKNTAHFSVDSFHIHTVRVQMNRIYQNKCVCMWNEPVFQCVAVVNTATNTYFPHYGGIYRPFERARTS